MNNTKRSVLCLSVLSALTLTGCNSGGSSTGSSSIADQWVSEGETFYNSLSNVKRRGTYTAYMTYFPDTLNTATTMQQADGRIITNFVDGLVEVNRYGRIVEDMAESWEEKTVDGKSVFEFNIRQGVKWMTNDGKGYAVNGQQAYVSAQDWVKGAEANLNFENQSESSYLLTMFIEGAAEYNYYTTIKFYQAVGGKMIIDASAFPAAPTDETALATYNTCKSRAGRLVSSTNDCIAAGYTRDITDQDIADYSTADADHIVTVDDLPAIANFSRVGVKASEDGKKLTYNLVGVMPYFLSALTYTPFLPIQTEFYNEVGASEYGTSRLKVLCNGAFTLSNFTGSTASELVLRKNPEYYNPSSVKIDTVRLLQLQQDITPSTSREGFESGTIDGFSPNFEDVSGWQKYVTGTDGSGTIYEPAHEDAYSVESVGDGSTFAYFLNAERDPSKEGIQVANSIFASTSTSYSDKNYAADANNDGNVDALVNTNKAMKIDSVRKLILASLDQPVALKGRYGDDPVQQVMESVNTYTPHDFVTIEGENDNVPTPDYNSYIKGAYIDEMLEGGRTEENWAKAEEVLGFGHIGGVGVETKPLAEQTAADQAAYTAAYEDLYEAAKADIVSYNAAHASSPISLPIVVEYTGLAYSDDSDSDDREFVNVSNSNINGCWVGGNNEEVAYGRPNDSTVCKTAAVDPASATYGDDMLVQIVKNTRTNIPNANTYSITTYYGATQLFISGWGPDYSDPLTFANTVVKDGDLSTYTGLVSYEDPTLDAEIDAIIGDYTSMVEAAAAITDPVARAEAFAKAEVELLFNAYVIRPVYMNGQGTSVSVSWTVPYRTTTAPFGLCSYKYKSVEVIDKSEGMLSKEQRAALKAEFEELKIKDLAGE